MPQKKVSFISLVLFQNKTYMYQVLAISIWFERSQLLVHNDYWPFANPTSVELDYGNTDLLQQKQISQGSISCQDAPYIHSAF